MTTTSATQHRTDTTPRTGSPVVVGIDGSTASNAALDWAVSEAEALDRPLKLLHAHTVPLPWPESMAPVPVPPEADDHVVEDGLARVGHVVDAVGVTAASVGGSAAGFLVEASETAALVVVGGPSHGALGSALVGSTTVEVAAQARCPVVVIRDRLPVTSLRRGVVVGSDGSEGSRAAVEEAFRRAARLGMSLTVVHVWSVQYAGADVLVPDLEVERLRAGEYGRALTAEMVASMAERYPEVVLQQEVVHGDPRRALTDVSRGAEMLVVGSRGRGEVTGLLLGSVSQALLRHASCPVMVVRPGAISH